MRIRKPQQPASALEILAYIGALLGVAVVGWLSIIALITLIVVLFT